MAASHWTEQWVERTLPFLRWEALSVIALVALYSLGVDLAVLRAQLRARRALAAEPSTRARTFAALAADVHAATKTLQRLAGVFLVHSLLLWGFDAGVAAGELAHEVADPRNADAFDASFALAVLGIFASLTATMVLAPLVQMALAACLVTRFSRNSGATTLEAYVPAARVLATHMCLLWFMLLFSILAFWPPVTPAYLSRGLCLQAVFGSGMAWADVAHIFNYSADKLADVKLSWPGVNAALKLFATKMVAVHSSAKDASEKGLPQYVDHVEDVRVSQ